MKHVIAVILFAILLNGCDRSENPIDNALNLRNNILSSNGTNFSAFITADYQDAIYTFELACSEDKEGNLSFTVNAPKSIAGITGILTDDQYALTFDDKVLAFPPLSDGEISPVAAPYFFMKALRSGYVSGCESEGDGYCIYIDDSFLNNQMHIQVISDINMIPVRAEIICNNFRVLSLDISNFAFL